MKNPLDPMRFRIVRAVTLPGDKATRSVVYGHFGEPDYRLIAGPLTPAEAKQKLYEITTPPASRRKAGKWNAQQMELPL